MNQAQQRIMEIVDDYKVMFPDEYRAFVIQQKEMRDGLINELASFQGDEMVQRKLFDMPATLHSLLNTKLTDEEFKYLLSDKSKSGARWFAKTFKEFRSANKL